MPANSFLGVFAKSPLKPLEEHITTVNECCQTLVPFFDAVYAKDWAKAKQLQQRISQLEKQADTVKRELRMNLPTGIFMPVDRNDLLELLTQQDRIANKVKDISGRIIGRELEIPELLQGEFMAYVQRSLDAAKQAYTVINQLDELLETGFKGRELDLVEEMIDKLDSIEDDTDAMQVSLRRELLSIEDQLNPVDVMFLYNILGWVGEIADISERVGARLEVMLAG